MQVALPELDGRLAARADLVQGARRTGGADAGAAIRPAPRRSPRRRSGAGCASPRTPRAERRLALVLSDYPARGGRAGFAVGLDTPASACAILDLLAEAGYAAHAGSTAPR